MKKDDPRIDTILAAITKIAAGNLNTRIDISDSLDEIDGIATGINMLAEEVRNRMDQHEAENKKLNETITQLRRVRAQLSDSEHIFSQVFQTSPDGISISRLDDGVFVEVNKSFEALTGYTRDELIGHSVYDFGMWTKQSVRDDLTKQLRETGVVTNLESEFRIKDGSIKRGLMSASLLNINHVPHLLAITRDITAISEAKKDLQLSQKKYEELIQFAPEGIILIDTEGRIKMANPAFLQIISIDINEVRELPFSEIRGFDQEDLRAYARIFSQAIKGKVPKPLEMRFLNPQRQVRHLEIHITPLRRDDKISGAQAVVRDISERIQAIEALRTSEGQYRTSMDSMQDSIYVLNQDLEILLANQALLTGLQQMGLPTDVIGKNYLEAFPFLPASTIDEYKEIFSKGKSLHKEDTYRIADHDHFTDTRLIPILENKTVTSVLTIVQDITDRKKIERIQQIMYNISNAVNITKDLNELFLSIQKELGSIFDTTNFFIAFYNKEDDTLTLPFFVDEKDSFEAFPAKKSLTGYMIRNDRPLLMKNKDIASLVKSGEIEDVGTPSKIWLGAPLKIKDEIIGALVVQHYEDELAYTEKDLEILQFVSSQIGLSIETKRAYDDVQVEKAYFEQLFEGSPECIVLTSNHGRLIRVNSEFQKLFGYSPEEAVGNYIDELIVPNEYLKEARVITRKVAKGEKILIETVRQHKDGSLILVSVMGTPIEIGSGQVGVYGIYRDITDRKKADIALRDSEEKLRNILYSSPDAITVSDLRGFITECNLAALDVFQCESDSELLGMNANQFVIPEMRGKGIEALKTILRNGFIKNIEFELITKRGNRIFVDLSASLIRDTNDKPIGIATITQNITERKAYERNLEEAKEKAEESDRLKSAFLANMSHEIRTPMNAILGFSELLRSEEISKEVRNEYTQIIQNKGNELMLIINDIIDISKIEAGDVKIVKLDLVVNDFLKSLYKQYKEEIGLMNKDHVQMRLSIPENVNPVIHTDQARLKQVLYNLISNALKFTQEGFIEIGYALKDAKVEFFVRDTGIGVTSEKQDIIFDRFRQVDESLNSQFGGTGLGLAISRNLVNLLGGEIWMESEEQRGSTFYFNLPLFENKEQDQAGIEENASGIMQGGIIDLTGRKILIAEDDSANYHFIESFLKRSNSTMLWARDGQEALDIFTKDPAIDMILMDLKMPTLNGIEATKTIRKTNKEIPIIALTAYAFADDKENSIKAGCNEYLSKPVKIEQLSAILTRYLK